METRAKCVTLVLGGARSGKSRYAQNLASHFGRVTFIATAQPGDAEMRRKISRHRRERPATWKTVEAPLKLHETIEGESRNSDVLLVDCLTLYVANVMSAARGAKRDPARQIEQLRDAIRASRASIIVVSNEVGSGIVPASQSGRIYRDLLGRVNQEIAGIADTVILMVAGLPMTVKDAVPGIKQKA